MPGRMLFPGAQSTAPTDVNAEGAITGIYSDGEYIHGLLRIKEAACGDQGRGRVASPDAARGAEPV